MYCFRTFIFLQMLAVTYFYQSNIIMLLFLELTGGWDFCKCFCDFGANQSQKQYTFLITALLGDEFQFLQVVGISKQSALPILSACITS